MHTNATTANIVGVTKRLTDVTGCANGYNVGSCWETVLRPFPGGGGYRLMFAGYGAAGLSEPLPHYSIFFGEL